MFQVAFLVIKTDAVKCFFCNTAKSFLSSELLRCYPLHDNRGHFIWWNIFNKKEGKKNRQDIKNKQTNKEKQREGFYFNQYILDSCRMIFSLLYLFSRFPVIQQKTNRIMFQSV